MIIVDDDDRENEGDLCMPAQFVTPEAISFVLRHTCGIICVPLAGERLDDLRIPMMVGNNEAQYGTAFTISVDAREGITTGVSAADRARTIQVLGDPDVRLARPRDAGPHLPAARPRRRRPRPRRPHRGHNRPLHAGGPAPRQLHLRAYEP